MPVELHQEVKNSRGACGGKKYLEAAEKAVAFKDNLLEEISPGLAEVIRWHLVEAMDLVPTGASH